MQLLLMQTVEQNSSWPEAIIAVGGITMITIILAVAIWQGMASWRARMSIAREDAYRKLAAESVEAQQHAGQNLELAASKLTDLDRRTAEIERLLKDVG